MKLRELHVRRMPGFEERGFRFSADQLGDALNLIVGPNGSGKTTACRAIRGLLWPATLKNASPVSLVGTWDDGREGVFLVKGGYGAEVEGNLKSGSAGKYEGYKPLVVEIVKFFKTGKPPVDAEETLEVLAFMEAAEQSKFDGGAPVSIESVMKRAEERISKLTHTP